MCAYNLFFTFIYLFILHDPKFVNYILLDLSLISSKFTSQCITHSLNIYCLVKPVLRLLMCYLLSVHLLDVYIAVNIRSYFTDSLLQPSQKKIPVDYITLL